MCITLISEIDNQLIITNADLSGLSIFRKTYVLLLLLLRPLDYLLCQQML